MCRDAARHVSIYAKSAKNIPLAPFKGGIFILNHKNQPNHRSDKNKKAALFLNSLVFC